MSFAFEKTPNISLRYKLIPVQYQDMNIVSLVDILCRIFNRKFQQVKQPCHSELPGFKEFIPETKDNIKYMY